MGEHFPLCTLNNLYFMMDGAAKVKVFLSTPWKEYSGSTRMDPLILNLGARGELAVKITP
jgi:hypothetical protein